MNTHTTNQVSAHSCPVCGASEVHTSWTTETFEYGEGATAAILQARIPQRNCPNCSFEYTDDEAEVLRHEAVCNHLHILAPRQIVAIREHYGMTQQEFADLTRLGRASLVRWERGALFQNPANDSLLYLLKFSDNVNRLKRRENATTANRNTTLKFKFRALSDDSKTIASLEAETFELFECTA